ncbi:peptidylprolyl isomerase [marine bacterium AO1-C]|nr:peptidylprolyl isomerase [marine bacterium AO1-C]
MIIFTLILGFGTNHAQSQTKKSKKDYLVEIKTSLGNIYLVLYEDTPNHRENFLRLAKKKFFKDLLFHRVKPKFMIQGGDPESRNAPKGKMLGAGGSELGLIKAEFHPHRVHKRGALAAARRPNPAKASSACQFYIVQGRKFTDQELSFLETQKKIQYTPAQRKMYKEQGGAAMLDQDYTVYGEVIQGMDVVDKIATQGRDRFDRPYKDIKMNIVVKRMRKKKITKKYGYTY